VLGYRKYALKGLERKGVWVVPPWEWRKRKSR
jgi:hypothetical protein